MYSQFSIYIIQQVKAKCQFGNSARQAMLSVPKWDRVRTTLI